MAGFPGQGQKHWDGIVTVTSGSSGGGGGGGGGGAEVRHAARTSKAAELSLLMCPLLATLVHAACELLLPLVEQ